MNREKNIVLLEKVRLLIESSVENAIKEIEENYNIVPIHDILEENLILEIGDPTPIQAQSAAAKSAIRTAFGIGMANQMGSFLAGNTLKGTSTVVSFVRQGLFIIEGLYFNKAANEYRLLAENFSINEKGHHYYYFISWIYKAVAAALILFSGAAIGKSIGKQAFERWGYSIPFLGGIFNVISEIRSGSAASRIPYIAARYAAMMQVMNKVQLCRKLFKEISDQLKTIVDQDSSGRLLNITKEIDSRLTSNQTASQFTQMERLVQESENIVGGLDSSGALSFETPPQLKSLYDELSVLKAEVADDKDQLIRIGQSDLDVMENVYGAVYEGRLAQEVESFQVSNFSVQGADQLTVQQAKAELSSALQSMGLSKEKVDEILPYFIDDATRINAKAQVGRGLAGAKDEAGESGSPNKFLSFLPKVLKDGDSYKSARNTVLRMAGAIDLDDLKGYFTTPQLWNKTAAAVKGRTYTILTKGRDGSNAAIEYVVSEYLPGGFVRFKMTNNGFKQAKEYVEEVFKEFHANVRTRFDQSKTVKAAQTSTGAQSIKRADNTQLAKEVPIITYDNVSTAVQTVKDIIEDLTIMLGEKLKSLGDVKNFVTIDSKSGRYIINSDAVDKAVKSSSVAKDQVGTPMTSRQVIEDKVSRLIGPINNIKDEITKLTALVAIIESKLTITLSELAIPDIAKTVRNNLDSQKTANKNNPSIVKSVQAYQRLIEFVQAAAFDKKGNIGQIENFLKYVFQLRGPIVYGAEMLIKLVQAPNERGIYGGTLNPRTAVEDAIEGYNPNLSISSEGNTIVIEGDVTLADIELNLENIDVSILDDFRKENNFDTSDLDAIDPAKYYNRVKSNIENLIPKDTSSSFPGDTP